MVSFETREAFVAAARGYLEGAQSIHQVHNEELTQLSDTEINAIWSMEDCVIFLTWPTIRVRPATMATVTTTSAGYWKTAPGVWRAWNCAAPSSKSRRSKEPPCTITRSASASSASIPTRAGPQPRIFRRCCRSADYRITALSHHDPAIAQAAARKFGVQHAFASADELVRHPEVDLVVIAVKVPRHQALVSLAIEAGKAVFCEWPLGVSLAEDESLRDLARTHGVATTIGLQSRATPAFVRLRELIAGGYVGQVLSVSMLGARHHLGRGHAGKLPLHARPGQRRGHAERPFAHSLGRRAGGLAAAYAR